MREIYEKLESFILEKISKTKLPSLAISVVEGGREAYSRAFGYRDVEKGLPAETATLYGIGSVTKSFTCLAIMKLREQGKLSIDDPVEKHLPLKLRVKGEPVRIWHLMTHSSGIPALAYAEALIRGMIGESEAWMPAASPSDVITFMRDAAEWAEAKPGERFFYLNEGYVLLGRIVEKVSGKSYDEYVRQEILEPLGMTRSYFNKEEVEKDGNIATPYVLTPEDTLTPSRFPWGIKADGGLISNVHDLARYIMMYLNRGSIDGAEIVSHSSIKEMTRQRIAVPWRAFGDEAYGYGWMITRRFHGEKLVAHGGSVLVYTAWVGFLPERRAGVIVLANGSGYPLSYAGMYALSLLLGKDPRRLPQLCLDELLDRLTGTYKAYKDTIKAKVYRRGDALYIEMGGKYTKRTTPLTYERSEDNVHVFTTPSGGTKLEVEFREEKDRTVLLYERYKLVKD